MQKRPYLEGNNFPVNLSIFKIHKEYFLGSIDSKNINRIKKAKKECLDGSQQVKN